VSEFDDLVKLDGVVMAGRFGPDGRIAEHKSEALFVENPQLLEMAAWFCAAATRMFKSMAFAVDTVMRSGFDQTSWLPQKATPSPLGVSALSGYCSSHVPCVL